MKRCYPSGKPDANIMLVGEAPGEHEIDKGYPFANPQGAGGMLESILPFPREDCYLTNTTPFRPPNNQIEKFITRNPRTGEISYTNEISLGIQELEDQIDHVKPDTIITLGNSPLWALTGEWGISKWRGSMLLHERTGTKILPTYHPAAILRQFQWKWIAQHDLKTAANWLKKPWPYPDYDFVVAPSFPTVMEYLARIQTGISYRPYKISVDIETSNLDISCIGFGFSPTEAICIPFTKSGNNPNYWTYQEELEIVKQIKEILEHPNSIIVGQNFDYDRQYLARCWGINSKLDRDTMTYHHTLFSQLPKGLDFLSSMYCEFHKYWKDESKTRGEVKAEDRDFWTYNCKDCVATYEVDDRLVEIWDKQENKYPLEFQMSLHDPVLRMTLKGVKIDKERQRKLASQIRERMEEDAKKFEEFTGGDKVIGVKNSKSPWWDSYTQTGNLFYDELGITPIFKGKSRTCDDEALKKIGKREPLVRRITARLRDYRSRRTYLSTFVEISLDADGRIRCQYKVNGTETFRFASSADAFGYGTNLQNFPKGEDAKHLPNLRTMFIPDPGFIFWDADLQQADAQVVAWESDCKRLKEIFKDPNLSLHMENCKLLYGKYPETHGDKNDPKGIYQQSKRGVHALHYGVGDKKMAERLEITQLQARKFRNLYFNENPEIPAWHDAVQQRLAQGGGKIFNPFGHFTFFFQRPEKAFTEALAWVPQSTVGITINHGLKSIHDNLLPLGVEPLLQTHDSLSGISPKLQGGTRDFPTLIQQNLEIPIPYPEPLTIGVEVKTSEDSWGACE